MGVHVELRELLEIDACARKVERERILALFHALATQLDAKADAATSEPDVGLAWTAAAASVRRTCDAAADV
jgi:gamma-glutamyl:cysteine ligase YbdK (ATP-grasp superfamily)